jgi:DNA-binding response OmpR family regulator
MTGADVRVAVVDDELFFREAICEILAAAGFECLAAEDGKGALELARDRSVGAMVLDVRMPGMDGLQVLRELRLARPELRVLVLSASTDQETVLEALRLGACDYLAKPLHDEELSLAVGRAVEVYRLAASSAQLRERLARLAALGEELCVGVASLAGEGRESYLREAAVDAAAQLLDADKTSLLLSSELLSSEAGLPEAGEELRVVASVGRKLAPQEMDVVPVGQAVAGIAVERAEALLVRSDAPDSFERDRVEGRYESDSYAVAPLVSGAGSFGVLCATDKTGGRDFDSEDLCLLRLLAGRIADLLAAGRDAKDPSPSLDREVRAREGVAVRDVAPVAGASSLAADLSPEAVERDAELVRGICEALVNHVEPERVLRAALEPIQRELAAVPVSLYLTDPTQARLVCEVQLDGGLRSDRAELPTAKGLSGTVLQTGHLVATESPELDSRFDPEVDTAEDGCVHPFLCLPLRMRGQIVGLCRVFLSPGQTPSARTGELLATALSAAVRNVLLYRSLVESIEEVADARRQARP